MRLSCLVILLFFTKIKIMIKSLPAKEGRFLVRLKAGHFPLIGIVYQEKTGLSSFFHHRVTEDTEEHFFCLSGDDDKQKTSIPLSVGVSGRRPELFMVNRHLPIFHKNFFSARPASRTSIASGR